MRGRRAKPAAVKKLQGEPGKRKLVVDHAPMREGVHADDGKSVATFPIPQPPKHLGKDAAAEWRRLAPWLREQGLLRDADLVQFEIRCKLIAECRKDEREIARRGSTYTHKGVARTRPEVRRLSDNRKQLRQIDLEFGLTPAARARVQHVAGEVPNAKQPPLPGTEPPAPKPAQPGGPIDLSRLSDEKYLRGPPN